MNKKTSTPRDASAVILLNHDLEKVLWARRNPKIAFLGGWHAFPGGKFEASDAEIEIKNSKGAEHEKYIASAVRECFEETGVLLARGGAKLTKGQRASLHDDLIAARSTFKEILDDWNLWLDAEDFLYTGVWTTPQFSPVRFKTRFFIAVCPAKQTPCAAITELENVEFIEPKEALKRWSRSEVLISPPVLISLKGLEEIETNANGNSNRNGRDLQDNSSLNPRHRRKSAAEISSFAPLRLCGENLLEKSQNAGGEIHYIELNPHLVCFPLKTDTLPPATHTNCFIVGRETFIVIDPASPFEIEQKRLHEHIDSRIKNGSICYGIYITHKHQDHIGGVTALKKHLQETFGLNVPIVAHALTAETLPTEIKVDELIEDDQQMKFGTANYGVQGVRVLHTPGHARGHLCFYFEKKGFLLSGDNVVSLGTVVIAPPEGDMTDYLTSLERMKNLPNLRFLIGSHGAAVFDAKGKIEEYIAHRLERETQVFEAFQNGTSSAREIAANVYQNLNPALLPLAEKSVEAHLEKLKRDGKI